MTTISPNYANVNFKATEQVQPKKAAETNAQSKPESKGMSNAMKVGLGLGALAAVALAGMAIKNKNAAKKLAENISGTLLHEKLPTVNLEKVEQEVSDVVIEARKANPSGKFGMVLISPKQTKEFLKSIGMETQNENAFICSVIRNGESVSSKIYDTEKIDDSILKHTKISDAWKNNRIYIKGITFVNL